MTNHVSECAFAVSFGNEPCDYDGSSREAKDTSSDIAKRHLALACESLARMGR